MFDFFQNVFGKVISLVASAIIAVGLVSVPEIPEQPLLSERPTVEIIEEVETKVEQENKIEKQKIIEKEILGEEIKTLNQKIQNLENLKTKEQNERIETLGKEITNLQSYFVEHNIPTPILGIKNQGESLIELLERERKLYTEAIEEDKKIRAEEERLGTEEEARILIEQQSLLIPSIEAIDAFLNNPTILNLRDFCIKSKTLPGLGEHETLNEDRKSIISEQNSLYSNILLCERVLGRPARTDPNEKYPYAWFSYSDKYFLDSDNFYEQSDKIQISIIKSIQEYNEKIKSFSDDWLVNFHCFCGLVSKENVLLEKSPKQTAIMLLERISQTNGAPGSIMGFETFLRSFSAPKKELIEIRQLLTF